MDDMFSFGIITKMGSLKGTKYNNIACLHKVWSPQYCFLCVTIISFIFNVSLVYTRPVPDVSYESVWEPPNLVVIKATVSKWLLWACASAHCWRRRPPGATRARPLYNSQVGSYRVSHYDNRNLSYKDKNVMTPSNLYDRNPYIGKMASLSWDSNSNRSPCRLHWNRSI